MALFATNKADKELDDLFAKSVSLHPASTTFEFVLYDPS